MTALLMACVFLLVDAPTENTYNITIETSATVTSANDQQQHVAGTILSAASTFTAQNTLHVQFDSTTTKMATAKQWLYQPELSKLQCKFNATTSFPTRYRTANDVAATAQANASLLMTAMQCHTMQPQDSFAIVTDTISIMGLEVLTSDSVVWKSIGQIDTLGQSYTQVVWNINTVQSRVAPNPELDAAPVTLNVELVRSIYGRTLFDTHQHPSFTLLSGSESWNMSFTMADGSAMSGATAVTSYSMTISESQNQHEK